MKKIGIIGAGTMGAGIAQVAALAGHEVLLFDKSSEAQQRASSYIQSSLNKWAEKGKITPNENIAIWGRISLIDKIETMATVDIIIEAIVEDREVKKDIFRQLENICSDEVIIATNTSSLSITQLASDLKKPERFMGIHFFNPAALMPLVEVIPGIETLDNVLNVGRKLVESWGKITVMAKDTPGFIVNKIARPFYGEGLKIAEEGIATPQEIDAVMKQYGFRMGPFELMDFIGIDVNYAVSVSVWQSFYNDARYTPSLLQKQLVDAGRLGRKTGQGFYDYRLYTPHEVKVPLPKTTHSLFMRIISMLINEAADTVYRDICSEEDVEIAAIKGVNYPKGLLAWGTELGWSNIVHELDTLFDFYHDSRYRVSPFLRHKIAI